MIRNAVAATAVVLVCGASAVQARRFAIACEGTSYSTGRYPWGEMASKRKPNPIRTTFVIDEEAKTIERALEPLQKFDNLCEVTAPNCTVAVSPGIITLSGTAQKDDVTTTSKTEIDRKSGAMTHSLNIDFASGAFEHSSWKMMCVPTAIPVFDTSRNKF
jgi:hypothetical protein